MMSKCGNTGCKHYNETFLNHCQSFAVIAVATCKNSQWVPASETEPPHDRTCRCDECEAQRLKAKIIEKDRCPCDECRHDTGARLGRCVECLHYDKFEPKEYLFRTKDTKDDLIYSIEAGIGLGCDFCVNTETEAEVCKECEDGSHFERQEPVEKDPDGLQQHEPGAKLDDGKLLAGLLQQWSRALTEVLKVSTFGAMKYSRGGWQHVKNGPERYTDAMFRHLLLEPVEDLDPDSGLMHEAHTAWNALSRLELMLREKENN